MAASRSRAQGASSSSFPCGYHVFLSFRGEDTRKRFTNYLYRALKNAGFRTFRDENDAEKGEPLDLEIAKGIQLSSSSVIVFSKDYASSTWCLDELVMILNRRRQISTYFVLPVFYDVDPTHVRKQTESFAEAFVRYDEIIEEEKDEKKKGEWRKKVKAWREALREAADLIGDVLSNKVDGYELEFIEEIVKVLEYKVNHDVFVESQLIGIDSRVKDINLWLQNESIDHVGIMAICGISGIGKTTIAQYAYDLNICAFQGSSFLANIKEVSKQGDGLIQLQRKLLSDIQKIKVRKITSVREGIIEIRDALHFRKVLVVLDDVDEEDQLDAILRMHKLFHPGSKILITTTNMQLLSSYKEVETMDVQIMSNDESLELLSWHAFGQHRPIEGYMEYSKRAVKQCGGLPLALEVLGATLRGKGEVVWRSALDRFEVIPNSKIQQKLQINYEFLPDKHHQDLFLDIACFFVGMDKAYVVTILNGCGYFSEFELQTLIDRHLVKIEHNKLMMHTLIQHMGREIICHCHLISWASVAAVESQDSFKVLKEKIGTETIRGLALNMNMPAEDMHATEISNSNNRYDGSLETNAFRCMQELRLLEINYIQLVGGYKEFPNNITWLSWRGFSLKSFPNDFPLKNLVVIDMSHSSLKQLWKGVKCMESLKILDLRHCDGLKKTPMFDGPSSLERLILKGCISLVEVHESIGNLQKLILLNMKDCRSVEKLPTNIGKLSSLETLNISGCSNLKELPSELKELKSLKTFEANEIDLGLLPSTNEVNRWWHSLMWFGRSRPRTRPELMKTVLGVLPQSLVTLSLEGCNLSNGDFPKDFSSLPLLTELNLNRNLICSLPDCVKGMDSLRFFSADSCTSLKTLVDLPPICTVFYADCPLLKKVAYASWGKFCLYGIPGHRTFEFKLKPVSKIDREIINNLGLSNIESIKSAEVFLYSPLTKMAKKLPIQVLSEEGIYSISLPGGNASGCSSNSDEAWDWSTACTSVHLIQNRRIHGFNISCVYGLKGKFWLDHKITISVYNEPKFFWTYEPLIFGVPKPDEYIRWLSHWKLNECYLGKHFDVFEPGDELNFEIDMLGLEVKEFKINPVYNEHEEKNDDEHEEKNEQLNSEDMFGSTLTFMDITFVEPMKGLEFEISLVCNEQEREDAQSNHEDMHGLPLKRRRYA